MVHSKTILAAVAAGLLSVAVPACAIAAQTDAPARSKPVVDVWMSPDCHCCKGWIKYMRRAGFTVQSHPVKDAEGVKKQKGVPDKLASCHTAVVDGYVIEGHVPASDIRRLLKERPRATGISVPNMPKSAPGMTPHNNDPYDVILFGPNEAEEVYSKH